MAGSPVDENHSLIGELTLWVVTLTCGTVVRIAAHAYPEEDDAYRFFAFLEARPPKEIVIAEFPKGIVSTIRGG